jgi:hypothetical protein
MKAPKAENVTALPNKAVSTNGIGALEANPDYNKNLDTLTVNSSKSQLLLAQNNSTAFKYNILVSKCRYHKLPRAIPNPVIPKATLKLLSTA